MVSHHLEIERKYEMPDAGAPMPQLSWTMKEMVAAPAVTEHLDATYFDTETQSLGRHKIAVRRRTGGYDQGWHIKFDAAGGRHEVGFDLTDDALDVPDRVTDFVRAAILDETLVPRVSLTTDRKRTVLSLAGTGDVAEICEDSVRAVDYSTGIQRTWCEWEVELLPAAEENEELAQKVFSEVETVLTAAGAVPSQSSAKIARALGQDADFERRLKGDKGGSQPSTQAAREKRKGRAGTTVTLPSSAQVLTTILTNQSLALVQADLLLKAGVQDATHRGRIAARQLRSTIKYMVRPYAKSPEVEEHLAELTRELKYYAEVFETNRNGELLADMLAERGNPAAGNLSHLMSRAQEQMQVGTQEALTYSASARRLAVQRELGALIADVTMSADLPLNSENYLNKVAKRLRKGILKTYEAHPGGEAGVEADESWHDIRKMVKAARYTLDSCQVAGLPLTEDQSNMLSMAKELQSHLGRLTDEMTFTAWLSGGAPQAPESEKPSYLYLQGYSDGQADLVRGELQEKVPAVMKELKQLKLK